jgi:hypothetical protein
VGIGEVDVGRRELSVGQSGTQDPLLGRSMGRG